MKIRIFLGILIILASSPTVAQESKHSLGENIGKFARTIRDSADDTSQNARIKAQEASDWFADHLSNIGETMSGISKNIRTQIDLFTYSIRQGYEQNE